MWKRYKQQNYKNKTHSTKGMLKPYSYNSGVLEAAFGATNENDRKTAADIIKIDTQKYDTTGWNNLLKLAGLK